MKKSIVIFLVVCLSVIFGCKNIEYSDEVAYDISNEQTKDVQLLLAKTRVLLPCELETSQIGIAVESQINSLMTKRSISIGRTVLASENAIEMRDLKEILEDKIDAVDVPDLLLLEEDDIKKIKSVFIDLEEEEIVENIGTITSIYQNMVTVLSANEISKQENTFSREIGYSDGAFYKDNDVVTWEELGAVFKHPFSAVGLMDQRDKAYELTKKYYQDDFDSVNNKADAFRHSIWNVVMAKEGWGLKGEKLAWARDFSTAHEKGVKYNGNASEMDLHNNAVGRHLYDLGSSKKYKKILWWKFEVGVYENSYEYFCNQIYQKAEDAQFVDKNLENTIFIEECSKISNSELVYIEE